MFEKDANLHASIMTWDKDVDTWETIAERSFRDGAELGYSQAKKQVESIIKRLVENKPDTYSGTDVVTNQKKMFAFSKAVNDAIDYLKESE